MLRPGQFGFRRKKRFSVEAVAVLMDMVQRAWKTNIAAALLVDIAAAFSSAARKCLLRKMRNMAIDEGLVGWVSDFMTGRRVRMCTNGKEGEEMEVTTGQPGPAVSPILFTIYPTEPHDKVETECPEVQAISFVDNITWASPWKEWKEIRWNPEKAGHRVAAWAKDNRAGLEIEIFEAIFSRETDADGKGRR